MVSASSQVVEEAEPLQAHEGRLGGLERGGFLGQALCRGLVERGHEVISLNRGYYPVLRELGVGQVQGDLADGHAVMHAAQGVDAIFHNAAKAGAWGSVESYFSANVTGTRNVLAAMRAHGIVRLVYTSTPSVTHSGRSPVEGGDEANTPYGEHFKAPYPATKLLAEKEVLAANGPTLATVALRPRLIWGPGDTQLLPRLVERAKAGRLRFIGGGHNRMDTTYIDNAAQAHLDAFAALRPGAACASPPSGRPGRLLLFQAIMSKCAHGTSSGTKAWR